MRMEENLVLGIDEAGRGPGLGPMVLAAVALNEEAVAVLAREGVKDSKAFGSGEKGRGARARLADRIRAVATWVSEEICEVPDIDDFVARGALNQLERDRARDLITRAPICKRIIADGKTLFAPLAAEFPCLLAVDRGESAHVAVAAASIRAKALRDQAFAAIASRYAADYGELRGGGYVNPATCAFVADYVRRNGRLPPEARKSWPWRGIPREQPAQGSTSALPWAQVR